jgi:hypothetical protein
MRTLRNLIVAALAIAGWLSPQLVEAQTSFELSCAAGTSPLLAPTYNPNTQKLRAYLCVDPLGTVTSPIFGATAFGNFQGQAAPVTAVSGTDVTLYTVSVPGGTFGIGHGLHVDYCFQHTTGGASATYKLFYGTTNVTIGSTANVTAALCGSAVLGNTTATNAQQVTTWGLGNVGGLLVSPATATGAIDSTVSQTLKVTFNIANSSDVVTPVTFAVSAY